MPTPRTRSVLVVCLAVALLGAGKSSPGNPKPDQIPAPTGTTSAIDYTYPEAVRDSTWIDVDIPSSSVSVDRIRILTANRDWTLRLCGSRLDRRTCTQVVGRTSARGRGWWGDFVDPALNLSYVDRDGSGKLHFLVTPEEGDWMIFRIQTQVTTVP